MPREVCWACRRPVDACLCPADPPFWTDTRIVLLMHPMEWKREKCTTGRLAVLNLANAEIVPGLRFDDNPRFRELVDDPENLPLLLYPGPDAVDLSLESEPRRALEKLSGGAIGAGGRRLVVFLIDATWACARVVARESPELMALPRIMFTPGEPSRWLIKRQPEAWCLSTLEAIHELLLALETAGLDRYSDKTRLLEVFARMQEYQIARKNSGSMPRHVARDSTIVPSGARDADRDPPASLSGPLRT